MAEALSSSRSSFCSKVALNIDDLDEVLALLERHKCSKVSYHQLGLRLKLSPNTLGVIEQQYKEQVDRCFTECLAQWLRKADIAVEDPTLETLENALRRIGQIAVADGINRERIPDSIALRSAESLTTPSPSPSTLQDHPQQPVIKPVYDRHLNEDATNEQHAVNIYRRHKDLPLHNIAEVATHLNKEKIISRRKQETIYNHEYSIDEKCVKLKMAIQKAISKDYKVLWIYACICDRTGNQHISRVIMTDFEETFKRVTELVTPYEEAFRQTEEELLRTNADNIDLISQKLNALIMKRYPVSIPVSQVNEGIRILRRMTTPFNTNPLQEVTRELDLNGAYEGLVKFNKSLLARKDCFDQSEAFITSAKMETLVIEFEIHRNEHYVQRPELLMELFGTLYHDIPIVTSQNNFISCTFPPSYGTLLIKLIFENIELCKAKGVQKISIGYFVLDISWADIVLKVKDRLEQKICELEDELREMKKKLEESNKKLLETEQERDKYKEELEKLKTLQRGNYHEKDELHSCHDNNLNDPGKSQKASRVLEQEIIESLINNAKKDVKQTKEQVHFEKYYSNFSLEALKVKNLQ